MPFQINLDACVLESVSPYPYILGNLMMNDYICGLDPQKADNRIVPQQFLSMFNDDLDNHQRGLATRHRTITQISSGVQGYATDPRGAALAYSKWLAKWYVGLGRIKHIFEGVFSHFGRMKILLREEGIDPNSIFTQKNEEAIIRSFCRCLLPDSAGAEDTAVDWYREALPHNKVHCLELCMDEHLFPQMDVESVPWVDPGTYVNHGGQTIPHFIHDTFADDHAAVLRMCFGEGHGNTLAEHSIGRLCTRFLQSSLANLKKKQSGTVGRKFNLQRTYNDLYAEDGVYSAVVCVESYFNIDRSEFRSVQPSLAALKGISLLCTRENSQAIYHPNVNPRLAAIKVAAGTDVEWAKKARWLQAVRTDLYRNLKASGFSGTRNAFAFATSYDEGRDHGGVQAMCLHPAENMGTSQIWSFWPHNNPKLDRGPFPRECMETIHMFDRAVLTMEAKALGFKSIAAPGDTRLNQEQPALVRPTAVHPVDVPVAAPAIPVGLAPQQQPRTSKAQVLEMEMQRITLNTQVPKRRKIEFFLDESHAEDPEGPECDPTGTGRIHSQMWVWGALILLLLTLVTYRHRF